MANMMKMMKQAADMQKNMQRLQEELKDRTVEFSSGGGMVTAVAAGDITTFYIAIVPTGLAMRALGKDPMRRRFDPEAESYLIPSEAPPKDRLERPF